jgi:hypothetical protein
MIGRMINKKWIGRKNLSPNRGAIATFSWWDWGKPRKASVRIGDIPAVIRIEHLPLQLRDRPARCNRIEHVLCRGCVLNPPFVVSFQVTTDENHAKSWCNGPCRGTYSTGVPNSDRILLNVANPFGSEIWVHFDQNLLLSRLASKIYN